MYCITEYVTRWNEIHFGFSGFLYQKYKNSPHLEFIWFDDDLRLAKMKNVYFTFVRQHFAATIENGSKLWLSLESTYSFISYPLPTVLHFFSFLVYVIQICSFSTFKDPIKWTFYSRRSSVARSWEIFHIFLFNFQFSSFFFNWSHNYFLRRKLEKTRQFQSKFGFRFVP